MRAALLALTLCLAGVLADDDQFNRHSVESPVDKLKPNGDTMSVYYYLKKPKDYKSGGPVFYGVAGRVSGQDLKDTYTLFNVVSPNFDNAAVVFAEQRHFGLSKSPVPSTSTLAALEDLKLDNVVEDHVRIIRRLNQDLNATNFLVFGGGHGAMIASYVAKRFSEDKELKDKYKVLGWSSSPPSKYVLRKGGNDPTTAAKEISAQFTQILKNQLPTSGTAATDCTMAKFSKLFTGLKAWSATTANINTLKLTPALDFSKADDKNELALYLRNRLIDLVVGYFPYKPDGNAADTTKLKEVCTAVSNIVPGTDAANALTPAQFNAVVDKLTGDVTKKLVWKVSQDGNLQVNQALVAAAYQDCTEYQIPICTVDGDALHGSMVGTVCDKSDDVDSVIKSECDLYFRGMKDVEKLIDKRPSSSDYPTTFAKNLITTMNTQSVFATGFDDKANTSPKNFTKSWTLGFSDNWEFRQPYCEKSKMKEVRYLALRAFGCLGGFVTDTKGKSDFCRDDKKIFGDDIAKDDDLIPTTGSCLLATGADAKFPFGQTPDLKFKRKIAPPPATKPPTLPPTTIPTTLPTTTQGGVGFIPSLMTVLASALLVWFTAL